MYAVIFKAEIDKIDPAYLETVQRMRALAMNKYGCCELTSCTEGKFEITISYWPNTAQIRAWKNDPEHQQAQALGKSKWYKSYQVQVVEILHQYGSST
jgi:heme-degrading monooxygenase HmoA